MVSNVEAEGKAFTDRIKERVEHGFVPDLRYLRECDFFYKSFWRKPLYAELYFGEVVKAYVHTFKEYLKPGDIILDYGCGPGYCALELARAGFKVVGIDVSDGAISVAKRYLKERLDLGEALDIEYVIGGDELVRDLSVVNGVLFSGVLHHLPNCKSVLHSVDEKLVEGGVVVAHEPQHYKFSSEDARFVATIRLFLEAAGVWYEKISEDVVDFDFASYVHRVHQEYITERDDHETGGQSPNDLSLDGKEIQLLLSSTFKELSSKPTFSFIYRTLGGLRADDEIEDFFAKSLAKLDAKMVSNGSLNANYFMWTGIKAA